jgi:hypothetical protein
MPNGLARHGVIKASPGDGMTAKRCEVLVARIGWRLSRGHERTSPQWILFTVDSHPPLIHVIWVEGYSHEMDHDRGGKWQLRLDVRIRFHRGPKTR